MKPTITFKAPWGLSLKLTTALGVCILTGIPALGILYNPGHEKLGDYESIWIISMVILPLLILAGAVFFMIRGYGIYNDKLRIPRPGWMTEIDLNGLQAVEKDPDAMKNSIRTFGNGGLFSFTGKFRNRRLGPYRAFVTNPKLAVILRFADKVIVVTPDDPDKFAKQVRITRQLS